MLCLWLSPSQLHPQTLPDLPTLLQQDAEESIPEEDMLILEEISVQYSEITPRMLIQLTALSILSDQEIRLLKFYARQPQPQNILNSKELSPLLMSVLKNIQETLLVKKQAVFLKHWVSASNGLRYRWRGQVELNQLTVGLYSERDPGEQNIADFHSFYLANTGESSEWIIGDHQLVAGFGLLAGRAFRPGKGFSSLTLISRPGQGLLPYRSSHEAWSNRGLGWARKNKFGRLTFSLGHNQREGQIYSRKVVTVNTTGIHRGNGIKLENNLMEDLMVTNWEYQSERLLTGVTIAGQQWSDSRGQRTFFDYKGIYSRLQKAGWLVYGEWAIGRNNVRAYQAGVTYRKPGFQYLLHGRKYGRGFVGFRSNPFSEWGGQTWNESGIYQALRFKIGLLKATLFTDSYSRPVSGFKQTGLEEGIKTEVIVKNIEIIVQRKTEVKETESNPIFSGSPSEDQTQRYSWRITCRNRNKEQHGMRWKIQYARVNANTIGTKGQGLNIQLMQLVDAVHCQLDWVITTVQNYQNRLYFWDSNLPGEMYSRMYSQKGHSPAIMVLYKGKQSVQLGFRARIWYHGYGFSKVGSVYAGLYLNIET